MKPDMPKPDKPKRKPRPFSRPILTREQLEDVVPISPNSFSYAR